MSTVFHKNYTGDKRYELSNHLGNVLQVITDRKLPVEGDNKVAYYIADVVVYNGYCPYGMLMPDRHGSEIEYSYAFQGQEKYVRVGNPDLKVDNVRHIKTTTKYSSDAINVDSVIVKDRIEYFHEGKKYHDTTTTEKL